MTSWRFERKFRADTLDHQTMSGILQYHPAAFRTHYPDRQINNVYFDTPEFVTFKENLAGISERAKYRLRWYGQRLTPESELRWEIKYKRNALGHKSVQSLENDVSLVDLKHLAAVINKTYPGPYRWLAALINSYTRSYFISADGLFRMTIDRDLRYFPIGGARSFTRYNFVDPGVILELKYEAAHDEKAGDVLDHMPFRQTKSSKYVTGMLMSYQ